jgi:5-carboxymethyl-2-hydroxymuconate isomerase
VPHLTMQYSANLVDRVDIAAVTRTARDALLETSLFEVGALRVRAISCSDYAIADLKPENAFLDMTLRIGAGRSPADKKRAGQLLYAAVSNSVAELFETPYFSLSLDICEIDPSLSWKTNAIHPRLRGTVL